MAAYTSVLVLLALCMASAYSLKCYTCEIGTQNDCMKTAICSANQTFCRVVVTNVGDFSYIKKDCVSECKNRIFSFFFRGEASCCTTDLCNVSGATSMQATYTILAVALGFLGALLKQSM
ncbi:ly6/PLAUR domain-containing protein 2-like [Pyxicephalus adspersus]|uniref:ly6/PLAUR domain-containing protein 2-like n=1 Tax=Pyxicephalus adspersus TaxID=30357 RepID=UPI003B5ACB55